MKVFEVPVLDPFGLDNSLLYGADSAEDAQALFDHQRQEGEGTWFWENTRQNGEAHELEGDDIDAEEIGVSDGNGGVTFVPASTLL